MPKELQRSSLERVSQLSICRASEWYQNVSRLEEAVLVERDEDGCCEVCIEVLDLSAG